MRFVAGLCLLVAFEVCAENAHLERAKRQVTNLQYVAAAKSLDLASRTPHNDRATVLNILELQGVVFATLNNRAKALEVFGCLHALDPARTLGPQYGPRVSTPFFEGASWASEHKLKVSVDTTSTATQVTSITVTVFDDTRLARRVQLHTKTSSRDWVTTRGARLTVTAAVAGARVEWWAEVLGEQDSQLLLVGSTEQPRVAVPARASAVTAVTKELPVTQTDESMTPPPAPPSLTEPPGLKVTESSPVEPRFRPLAWATLGLGAGAAAGGIIAGVRSSAAQSRLKSATLDLSGRVVSLTQRQALALESQQRDGALWANVLLVSAAVLVTSSVLVWWLGSVRAPTVALTPTPSGFALVGVLP